MDDIKHLKIGASQLSIGMFVTELDIPWLESPFLMQGFVIENDKEIATLQKCCQYVYIDRTKSTGAQFVAAAKQNVAFKREGITVEISSEDPNQQKTDRQKIAEAQAKANALANKQAGNKEKIKPANFMDVMRAIKKSEQEEGVVFNMQYVHDNALETPEEVAPEPVIQSSGFNPLGMITGLFSRKNKSEKLSTQVDDVEREEEEDVAPDSERLYMYNQPIVEEEIVQIYPVFERSNIAARQLFESIADAQNLDLTTVNEVLDSMVESISRTPDALMWLSKLKNKDNKAYNQALHVSINMMAFSSFLALPKNHTKDMGMAGLLQDIGKSKLPDQIINKRGKLTSEEYSIAKQHVDHSLDLLEKTPEITSNVILLVSQHHERVDGSGYPYKLTGKTLPLMSQMAGIIDTYCALTSNRTYAQALYNQQALDEIHKMSGKQFTRELVEQLVQFLGMYPVSSLVELNTGEVGVVIQQNQVRRLLPRVMILLGADKVKNAYPKTIDLIAKPLTPTGDLYSIVRGLPPDAYGLNPSDFYML